MFSFFLALPVATEPPELINVGTTWVVLKIHIKSYKGVDPYFWQPVVINQNQVKLYIYIRVERKGFGQFFNDFNDYSSNTQCIIPIVFFFNFLNIHYFH